MGTLRTVLALLVVHFHVSFLRATDLIDVTLPDGRVAVQMFYLISGFFMALILNEKYIGIPNATRLFYTNRILRLWPVILVVHVLIILSWLVMGQVVLVGRQQPIGEFLAWLAQLDVLSLAYLLFTNVFILGHDYIFFVRIDPASGISFAPFQLHPAHNGITLSLNHPLFTVAIEAAFYLVSPLLLRRGFAVPFALFIAGGLYHVALWYTGRYNFLWGYHFFVSAAYFYFLGACAYHLYRWIRSREALHRQLLHWKWPTLAVCMLGFALMYGLYGTSSYASLYMALVLAPVVPVLFLLTQNSRIDRYIGELSFSIYVIHYPALLTLNLFVPPEYMFRATVAVSVLGAMLLYQFVEKPVDRWRQRRVRS